MGFFGFDFNGDGNVGLGEHMMTMDLLGFFDSDEGSNDNLDVNCSSNYSSGIDSGRSASYFDDPEDDDIFDEDADDEFGDW